MNLLSIIDKIYENSYFSTLLVTAIIILIVLFVIVLFLGLKDAKKSKEPPKEAEEDVKDITFENIKEIDNIKEDVTFEMPTLTKNLENFKKNLEEEIKKEDNAQIRKTSGLVLNKSTKPAKILDIGEIEGTAIIPIIKDEKKITNKSEDIKNTQVDNLADNF